MDASVSAKATSSTFEADVREIVTAKYVRTAGASDAVAGVQPRFAVEPGSEQELAKVLKLANVAGLGVTPRGGGTKLEWGNRPAQADVILSTARLHRVIEHAWADLTVSAEAGCTIAKLQETLAKHGQRLALDALWPERATDGGEQRRSRSEECGGVRSAEAGDGGARNAGRHYARHFSIAPVAEGEANDFLRDDGCAGGAAACGGDSEFEAGAFGAADLL